MTRKPRKNNRLQEPMLKIKNVIVELIFFFSIFMVIDGIFGINIYFTVIYELILY